MTVTTLVIRLVAEQLERGEFVGQVEDVASGETATVHTADELARFAERTATREPPGPE